MSQGIGMRKHLSSLAIAAVIATGSACASFGRLAAPMGPGSVVIGGVPFVPAAEHECGPAALVEAMGFWGSAVSKDDVARATLVPALRGALPFDLAADAERRGFIARTEYGDLESLKKWIRSGRPAILQVDYGLPFFPMGHYLLVYGFDENRRNIIAHSSMEKEKIISYANLDRVWSKTGRWALVIEPIGRTGHEERQ